MLAEAFGGWFANSLALLADAGHMLTDVAALTLTLAAIWFAARPATPKKTSVTTVWKFSPHSSTASRWF
jgi:cobalt-zinc-cadmium efflux system protein